jgi:hypothetical protein
MNAEGMLVPGQSHARVPESQPVECHSRVLLELRPVRAHGWHYGRQRGHGCGGSVGRQYWPRSSGGRRRRLLQQWSCSSESGGRRRRQQQRCGGRRRRRQPHLAAVRRCGRLLLRLQQTSASLQCLHCTRVIDACLRSVTAAVGGSLIELDAASIMLLLSAAKPPPPSCHAESWREGSDLQRREGPGTLTVGLWVLASLLCVLAAWR